MVEGLDKSLYTEATVANLTEPMANAKAVLANVDATQEEVDSAYAALIRAYLDLRLIPNKDLLAELINKANSLNAANYSAKSWSVMTNALEEAKAVLANENADEAAVKAAIEGLQAGIDNLVANSSTSVKPGDTTNLINSGDKTVSVDTGDTTNMISVLGLMASLSTIAYLKKKRFNR